MSHPLFRNRTRAESFGSIAAAYDQFRPTYPDELFELLTGLGSSHVVDIGCGTGKAAVQMAQRGFSVLGVEIDPAMAQIACAHGIPVEVASFETWDARGRTFDLATCGQAWHWINPAIGISKVAQLLEPGGSLVLFWNFQTPGDANARTRLNEVYARHAPELVEGASGRATSHHDTAAALRASGRFPAVETRTFHRQLRYTAADWVGLLATHSDHNLLPVARLDRLLNGVFDTVQNLGGSLGVDMSTEVVMTTISGPIGDEAGQVRPG